MADYYSPTVVTPFIPTADIMPLERLILGMVFDEETDENGRVFFHSSCGPSEVVAIEAKQLRQAHEASRDLECGLAAYVALRLAETKDCEPHDYIELDLSAAALGWDGMLQSIVRRSPTLDEIIVTVAFTCSRMRPDGFGGSITRITAKALQYGSTTDILAEFRADDSD